MILLKREISNSIYLLKIIHFSMINQNFLNLSESEKLFLTSNPKKIMQSFKSFLKSPNKERRFSSPKSSDISGSRVRILPTRCLENTFRIASISDRDYRKFLLEKKKSQTGFACSKIGASIFTPWCWIKVGTVFTNVFDWSAKHGVASFAASCGSALGDLEVRTVEANWLLNFLTISGGNFSAT